MIIKLEARYSYLEVNISDVKFTFIEKFFEMKISCLLGMHTITSLFLEKLSQKQMMN